MKSVRIIEEQRKVKEREKRNQKEGREYKNGKDRKRDGSIIKQIGRKCSKLHHIIQISHTTTIINNIIYTAPYFLLSLQVSHLTHLHQQTSSY